MLRFAKASRNVLHFAEVISEAHAKLGTFSTNVLGLEQSDRTRQEMFAVLRKYRQSCDITGKQNTAKQSPAQSTRILMFQGIASVHMIQGIVGVLMFQGIVTMTTTTGFFQTPSPQAPGGLW